MIFLLVPLSDFSKVWFLAGAASIDFSHEHGDAPCVQLPPLHPEGRYLKHVPLATLRQVKPAPLCV